MISTVQSCFSLRNPALISPARLCSWMAASQPVRRGLSFQTSPAVCRSRMFVLQGAESMCGKFIRFTILSAGLVCLLASAATQPAAAQKPLQIYFVDVEGGQATLFVTPAGQSLLIDTGWSGFENRDADRIVAAAKNAGIAKIDFVLLTHYHRDHSGGVPQLAAKIPIGAFLDHGENREPSEDTEEVWQAYLKTVAQRHLKRT